MRRWWTQLLQITFFVGVVALLCAIAFSLPPLQTRLALEVESDQAGVMQIFSPVPGLGLQQSRPRDVRVGTNRMEFVLPHVATEVRWDPLDGPARMRLQASILFLFTEVPIRPRSVQPTHQIGEVTYGEQHISFATERSATNPIFWIEIPWQELAVLKLPVVVLIAVASGAALLAVRHVARRPPWFGDPLSPAIFGSALLLVLAAAPLIGTIPIGNGEGWDGGVYLNHIQAITQGGLTPDDPYRLFRMGGFLPALIVAGHGLGRDSIWTAQALSAVLFAAASVALLFDFLRGMGVTRNVALISSGTFICSWPLLVMPVFYPVLTDHLAVALTCLAMWLWSRGATRGLYLLCAWAPWVHPGLFVVPLILAAIPRVNLAPGDGQGVFSRFGIGHKTTRLLLFCVIAIPMTGGALTYMVSLNEAELVGYFARLNVDPLSGLRDWSIALTIFSLTAVAWIWAATISSGALWRSIRMRPAFVAAVLTALSFLSSAVFLDWDSGFAGPQIGRGIFLQALAAPLRPLVSHVLHFGPVFLFGLLALFTASLRSAKVPWPLVGIVCAYLPVLALGTESRQWLPVFPIIVALFALAEQPFRLRVLCLICGVGLCIPALGLADTIQQAMSTGTDYSTREWQAYFGRQGPWMSAATYQIGLALTNVFAIAGLFVLASRR